MADEPTTAAAVTGNYYAMCAECEPLRPMPFAFVEDREEWVEVHKEATGHRVLIAQDVDFGPR